jgi:hypothetical protein
MAVISLLLALHIIVVPVVAVVVSCKGSAGGTDTGSGRRTVGMPCVCVAGLTVVLIGLCGAGKRLDIVVLALIGKF